VARKDWGWEAKIPLASLVEIMITNLRQRITPPPDRPSRLNLKSLMSFEKKEMRLSDMFFLDFRV
jgi:hypothetical protein